MLSTSAFAPVRQLLAYKLTSRWILTMFEKLLICSLIDTVRTDPQGEVDQYALDSGKLHTKAWAEALAAWNSFAILHKLATSTLSSGYGR